MFKWEIKESYINKEIIKNNPEIHPLILQVLNNRGFSIKEIKKFLEPDYDRHSHNPFLFKDMKKAVELIKKHLDEDRKIVIYGDYDADGVTAAALLFKTLKFLKPQANLQIYIPDRVTEGYGLNEPAVRNLAKEGAGLIITVDNGIRNKKEVELAKKLKIEIIITDHHKPASNKDSIGVFKEDLPACLILNPKIKDEAYPFKELAGVGVAFKLAQALLSTISPPLLVKEGDNNKVLAKKKAFEKWLLDLVAIGTVADCVSLLDENRVLVKYGLLVLNKTQRIGLQKLIAVAQSAIDKNGNIKEIDAWQIGFQLAPRLNAAGRLDHANNAYQLLITDNKDEAISIAKFLNFRNQERQRITEEIFKYVEQNFIKATKGKCDDKIIIALWPGLINESSRELELFSEPWPSGVMGLVSGKLTEKYYRPSLAITENKDEIVGSGRSIKEFDITEMLEECREFLSAFGGHKQACGFTLISRSKERNLKRFLEKVKKIAEHKLKDLDLSPTLNIDLKLDFKDIDENLFKFLQKLRPFGQDNPQPKFITEDLSVINTSCMGNEGQHLRLKLKDKDGFMLKAVGFSVPEEWKKVKIGDKVSLVYYIDVNKWNSYSEIQLKIIDLKLL